MRSNIDCKCFWQMLRSTDRDGVSWLLRYWFEPCPRHHFHSTMHHLSIIQTLDKSGCQKASRNNYKKVKRRIGQTCIDANKCSFLMFLDMNYFLGCEIIWLSRNGSIQRKQRISKIPNKSMTFTLLRIYCNFTSLYGYEEWNLQVHLRQHESSMKK